MLCEKADTKNSVLLCNLGTPNFHQNLALGYLISDNLLHVQWYPSLDIFPFPWKLMMLKTFTCANLSFVKFSL